MGARPFVAAPDAQRLDFNAHYRQVRRPALHLAALNKRIIADRHALPSHPQAPAAWQIGGASAIGVVCRDLANQHRGGGNNVQQASV